MIIFKQPADLLNWLNKETAAGKSIGFVPTMGALHAGHMSLITISKKDTDITVCSIFVNPTQFNNPKDFQKYPITLEKDIALLETAGVDILFLPGVDDLYPTGPPTSNIMIWARLRPCSKANTGRVISRVSARSCIGC